jgi:serine/threonine protein kinase
MSQLARILGIWHNGRMPPFDSLIGHQLANFRIERLLGRGGMAKVYYGWDVKLERPVAVKVINEHYRYDLAYTERFLREARAVATWNHPNILHVYHAGDENGIFYFAMEYVRGLDLGQINQRYANASELLPLADVLKVGHAVASALDYAHLRGVIHRDVKPSNVLVSDDDRIVLADFGLALTVSHGTIGEVFGSPHYISPEQARNSAETVPQSDLYSLGVMLYEMLVGVLPFDDPSPASLALMHLTQEPPAPRAVNPSISLAVQAVLLKALRKSPEERYQTGRELVDALEHALLVADPADTQPVTMPLPLGTHLTQPSRTLSKISMAEKVTASTLKSKTPLISGEITSLRSDGSPQPGLSVRSPVIKIGAGCAVVVLAAVFLTILIMGVTSALIWSANLAKATSVVGNTSSLETPLAAITPTGAISPTLDQPADIPGIISGTQTTSPSLTHVLTSTPAQTETPTLTPTRDLGLTINLLLAKYKDDSLIVVNEGLIPLPLEPLLLKNSIGEVSGQAWEVDLLQEGECVAAWKDTGRPKRPEEVDCKIVGKRLEFEAGDRFWTTTYKVYYDDVEIGSCVASNDQCQIKYPD